MESASYVSLFRIVPYNHSNQVQNVFNSDGKLHLFQDIAGKVGLVTTSRMVVFLEGNEYTDSAIFSKFFDKLKRQVIFVPVRGVRNIDHLSKNVINLLNTEPGFNFYYCIRDRDFMDDKSREKVADGNQRIFVLSRYHVENYLLDWELIYKVITKNNPQSRIHNGDSIKQECRKLMLNKKNVYCGKLISYALNKNIRPKVPYFDVGMSQYEAKALSDFRQMKEELSSSWTENQVRTIIEEQIDLINDWFGSDQWYLRLPGKDILKCLIQNSVKNLPYEYFKNQLIAEFNEPPKELENIIKLIIDGS